MHSKSRSLVLYTIAILVIAVMCSISFFATPELTRLEARATSPKVVQERSSHDYPHKIPAIQNRDDANGTLQTCDIEGNADIYGIGIRIGFYLQVLASGIALVIRPDDAKGFFATNAWFQIGLFVALIYNSANDSIYAVEGFIAVNMLYLLVWYNGALVLTFFTGAIIESMEEEGLLSADKDDSPGSEQHGPKTGSENEAISTTRHEDSRLKNYGKGLTGFPRLSIYAIPIIGNMLLFAATQFYSTWFWWRGLNSLQPGPCSDRGFFFANVDLHGWFRWFHRIFNLLMVAGWGFGIVLLVVVGLIYLFELCLYCRPGRSLGTRLERRYPILEKRRLHYGEWLAGKRKWWQIGNDESDDDANDDLPQSHALLDSGEPNAIPLQSLPSNTAISGHQAQPGNRLSEEGAARSIAKDQTTSGEVEISDQALERPQFNRPFESRQEGFEAHPDQYQPPQLAQEPLSINAERQGVPPRQNTDSSNTSSEGIRHDDMETSGDIKNLIQTSTWALSLTLFLFNLLTIELSIRWNHITGVNKLVSTGQLIPFVIGVGGMCRSCWIAGKRFLQIRQERKKKGKKN